MIGQADSDDGVSKPRLIWKNRLIKWQSREVKWEWFHFYTRSKLGKSAWIWFHFYTSLKLFRKLCLKPVSFLHKLETETKYAWYWFACPPAWWLNLRYMPPSFMAFTWVDYWLLIGGWNEVSITRSGKKLDLDFTRSNQRLKLNRKLFHSLTRLTE